MTTTNIIEGMQIVEKYRPVGQSPHHVRAEHDHIYIGSLEWPIPKESQDRLEELGWYKDVDAYGYGAMV